MIRWLQLDDLAQAPAMTVCPNCGSIAPCRPILTGVTPSGAETTLAACVGCGAHHFNNVDVGDYEVAAPGGGAALAIYLQQGADVGGIAMRLTGLDRPPGTRYLEIGCGFGFGLDFAWHALGWQVTGIDPSPFAAHGRELLGLPIESRYFGSDGGANAAAYDVVHASEFLEHVAAPLDVLRDIRATMRPGGTLLLTTPAAEMISPSTSEGLLIPLLSVGWHIVIQTASSLTMLLHRAGFENVCVRREGAQLVAFAGGAFKAAANRSAYQNWLQDRAAASPPISDLGIGLRARLFRERAGAGDDAVGAWVDLDSAIYGRFGRGLVSWCGVNGKQPGMTLEALAESEPLCLAGVLLLQGLRLAQAGKPAEAHFEGALAASRRLRQALRAIGSDDPDAEDVGLAAERELLVCAAERGEPGLADRIDTMQANGATNISALRRRCFVTLVNHGHLADARRFNDIIDQVRQAVSRMELLSHEDASILFCAAGLELQTRDGRIEEAVSWLTSLRSLLMQGFLVGRTESARILFWPAVEAEALGLRLCNSSKAATKLLEQVTLQAAQIAGFPIRPAG